LKLAIVNLTSGGLSGGYKKYLETLVPLLRNDKRISDLAVYVHPRSKTLLNTGDTFLEIEKKGLKSAIRHFSPNVILVPTFRHVDFDGVPSVIMIRNMEMLSRPFGQNSIVEAIRNGARAFVARRSCQKASRIIAVSNFVKAFLIDRWKINSEKVGVVYHGVSQMADIARPAILRNRTEPFIFTAGSIIPYRGLEDLISSLGSNHIKDSGMMLVVAGQVVKGSEFYKRRLERLAINLGVDSRIIWAGQLSNAEMAWCYQTSKVFVMTSRVEACPNVVLEAMAHGCISVSTDSQPMPEFYSDTALYYSAGDSGALAKQLLSAASITDAERHVLSNRTLERASNFTWASTADSTIKQLQMCL
jgi:glycosyltransferase involved in cell wall biosynthesis